MNKALDHKQILREKLSQRMSTNPLYSLRAFARDLEILPQTLSHIMNGTKGLSGRTALSIAKRLNFSKTETEYFCNLVESKFARSETARKVAGLKLSSMSNESAKTSNLTLDSFRVISDWYHFGLIELLKISGSQSKNHVWLSKRLGIQETEVKMTLERLERLELIVKTKNGYSLNQDTVFTTDGVPSDALKKFHKQVLEKAIASIALQSIDERNILASFMPIDSKDLPKAKKTMADFREQFVKNYSKETGDSVYALSMQFFNLTNKNEK